MLKDILKLNGIKELDKNQQKNVSGGFGGFGGFGECPTLCQTAQDCLPDGCGFTFAICASGGPNGSGICFVA